MHLKKCWLVALLSAVGFWACLSGKVEPLPPGDDDDGRGDHRDRNPPRDDDDDDNTGDDGFETVKNLPDWGLGEPGVLGESVTVDVDGSLTVRPSAGTYDFMWLPDITAGTVSKFDVNSGKELARYYSVSHISCKEGERPDRDRGCTGQSGATVGPGYAPGRVSVDIEGNVWVANSGGLVTKIAATLNHCVDRNKDGEIRTSRVVENANQTLSLNMETDDECVLFSTQVCPRMVTLAISRGKEGSAGDVWVVCLEQENKQNINRLYKLDSGNGRILFEPIPLGALFSAEAMVDSKQILWLTHNDSHIQGIDTTIPRAGLGEDELKKMFLGWDAATNKPALIKLPTNCSAYGIAADSQGRLWFAARGSSAAACFYDHYAAENKKWQRCAFSFSGNFRPRGIAFDTDDNAYMSGATDYAKDTRITRFRWNKDKETCEFVPLVGSENVVFVGNDHCPHTGGIGFDSAGNPWVTGYPVTRLNLKTGKTEPVTRAPPSDAIVFQPVHYFSLSDFTGYQIRNFIAPRGRYQQTLFGCDSNSSWKSASWEATVPEGSKLQVYVRASNDKDIWDKTYGPFETSPVNLSQLGLPKSSFLQLEFVFLPSADRQSSPAVHGYELKWACERAQVLN